MNNYPEWWNTTVTVFNKYEDPATRKITWYKTVLHNCFWKYTGNKIVVGQTTLDTNTTLCRIPINDAFLEKHEWVDKSDKSTCFTLGAGDFIIKGDIADNIDEYVSGQRSSDVIAKYKKMQGCMVIEQYTLSAGLGRGQEHYFVRGV